jgi:hypothetical protein
MGAKKSYWKRLESEKYLFGRNFDVPMLSLDRSQGGYCGANVNVGMINPGASLQTTRR